MRFRRLIVAKKATKHTKVTVTKVPTETLTSVEATALAKAEMTIRGGIDMIPQVAAALGAIRDDRLYRATDVSFEDYCQREWSLSLRQAKRYIATLTVSEDLAAGLPAPNLRQSAALNRIPKAKRGDVWAAAVRATPKGKAPTAASVAEAAKTTSKPVTPKAPTPKKPALKLAKKEDPEIPATIQACLDLAPEFRAVQKLLREVDKAAEALSKKKGAAYFTLAGFKIHTQNAWAGLKFGTPHCVCPVCKADPDERRACRNCQRRGWITADIEKRVPEELK